MIKRIVIVSMLLMLVFTVSPAWAASAFPDIDGHWAEDEITYLAGQGLVSGFPDGTFKPSETVTRAQVAAVVAGQLGLDPEPAAFPDVPSTHWANEAIGALVDEGIMSGYPNGTFQPSNPMTRAEVAVVLTNAYGYTATSSVSSFADVSVSFWAFGNIQALYDNYITIGYPDGTYKPSNTMTRAEFSIFMAKSLNPVFVQPTMLTAMAADVAELLQNEDMAALAALAHPTDGIRFSPYTWVENNHQVFSAAALPNLLSDNSVYFWGIEDGTGDNIDKTPQEYFDRFVTARDFTSPDDIQYNTVVARGSLLNNIPTFYPNALFVEFYVVGTAQFGGLDWRSQYIVMEEYNGDWYVVAIVNGEWTT